MLLALSRAVLAAVSLAGASGAIAAVTLPVFYDAPNGDGQAHGGNFNYWDKGYTGSGSTTLDGTALSGGHGDLTDGVIATQNWFEVENTSGDGPYVGWKDTDPTIVLHFSEPLHLLSLSLHADDADGQGGVFAPGGITIGGTTYAFDDPAGSSPNVFAVTGLSLVGQDIPITIHRRAGANWTFVSEITFTALPEPGSWALGLGGIPILAAWQRRQAARRSGPST